MSRSRKNRKPGRPTPIIILLLMVIGLGLFGIHFWERREQLREAEIVVEYDDPILGAETASITVDERSYTLRRNLDTFLLIGLDKVTGTLSDPGNYTNNKQADFLFLIVLDHGDRSYCAIHLNRDAMTEIQRLGMSGKKIGVFTGQLALSHTYGSGGKDSCRNTVKAVSHYLLDIPVEHYFSLTMDAIPVLNDLVGGVVVHIDDDFSAIDPSLELGKDIRLRGQQALTFARTRYSVDDSSNLSRMNRQRAYLYGLHQQLTEKLAADNGFGARLISRLADFNVTDLTSDDLMALSEKIKGYQFTGIRSIQGQAVLGEKYMEFYTDESDLQQLVLDVFYNPAG